jgi:hypothetical protein
VSQEALVSHEQGVLSQEHDEESYDDDELSPQQSDVTLQSVEVVSGGLAIKSTEELASDAPPCRVPCATASVCDVSAPTSKPRW